jgi:predicted amidophosphoribosyltransferase
MTTTSKTTVCPTCGHEMPVGAKFCLNCGKKLSDDPRLCPKCGHKIIQGMKFCQNCGTPISEMMEQVSEEQSICPSCGKPIVPGTKFCRYCGAAISEDSGEPETENDEIKMEKPTEEPKVEPVEEPKVEPVEEPKVEPVEEPKVEPVEEPKVEPVEEPKVEPVEEPKVEPVEEPATEPVAEPATEPVAEPATEPVAEPAAEPAVEPKEQSNSIAGPNISISTDKATHKACGLPFKILTGAAVIISVLYCFTGSYPMVNRIVGLLIFLCVYSFACAILGLISPSWSYSFGTEAPSRSNTFKPFLLISISSVVVIFIMACIFS